MCICVCIYECVCTIVVKIPAGKSTSPSRQNKNTWQQYQANGSDWDVQRRRSPLRPPPISRHLFFFSWPSPGRPICPPTTVRVRRRTLSSTTELARFVSCYKLQLTVYRSTDRVCGASAIPYLYDFYCFTGFLAISKPSRIWTFPLVCLLHLVPTFSKSHYEQ